MHICYVLSKYISYRTSGLAYVECLRRLGHTVSLDPACLLESNPSASGSVPPVDLAVLHGDPQDFPAVFAAYPRLRRIRSIGYAVWETDILPKAYRDGLSFVDEVWTCSEFSRAAFAPHFSATAVVPHVVQRRPVSSEAAATVRALIRAGGSGKAAFAGEPDAAKGGFGGRNGKDFFFLCVVDAVNPRKNIHDLLAVFSRVRAVAGEHAHLVLKQYRAAMDFSSLPGVRVISERLSEEEMAALYRVCHAYVSAHRAEAWGLGMSEAMAWGKPVAATGYSGNMEFMTAENSFPLPYTIVPVSEDMVRRHPMFSADMRWAQVDTEAMEQTMLRIFRGRCDETLLTRAAEVTRRFGLDAAAERIRALL